MPTLQTTPPQLSAHLGFVADLVDAWMDANPERVREHHLSRWEAFQRGLRIFARAAAEYLMVNPEHAGSSRRLRAYAAARVNTTLDDLYPA